MNGDIVRSRLRARTTIFSMSEAVGWTFLLKALCIAAICVWTVLLFGQKPEQTHICKHKKNQWIIRHSDLNNVWYSLRHCSVINKAFYICLLNMWKDLPKTVARIPKSYSLKYTDSICYVVSSVTYLAVAQRCMKTYLKETETMKCSAKLCKFSSQFSQADIWFRSICDPQITRIWIKQTLPTKSQTECTWCRVTK